MSARIGFVHFGTYPDIRVVKMTDTLAKAGYEVILLARNIKGVSEPGASHPYAHLLSQKGEEWRGRLQIRRLLDEIPERWRAPLTLPYHVNPVWRRAIRDLVVRDGCRLLIVRDMPLVLAATAVGRRYGVPVIFDMAENYPAALSVWRRYEGVASYVKNAFIRNVTLARLVERMAARASDHVFVVVHESAERVEQLGVSLDRITVVENTPDLEAYKNVLPAVQVEALTVVYTGEIHLYRGIPTTLEAANILYQRGEQCLWWFVGSGKLMDHLRSRSAHLEQAGVVVWHGWKPHSEMLAILSSGHVGIVPHIVSEHTHNTMPNKVYDYMAFRKPVLVSDCRPMRRLVEEVGCGLVFRSQSAEDLAEKVLILRDPALRAEMGERGRKAVEERYNWSVDGQKLLEVVGALLSQEEA